VLPSLQREVERCLPRDAISADHRARLASLDRAVALIEEGSARELLDLLSTRRESAAPARIESIFVPVDGLDPSKDMETHTAGAPAGRRNRRAAGAPDQREAIAHAVAQQRDIEEEHWLANPLATQGVDPEISHLCRQFSAERFDSHRGPLLIRFFQRIAGDYWAIAYFKGDTFGPLPLADRLPDNLADLASREGSPPREYHCKELWEVFFEPVLKSVMPPSEVQTLERLVLVPCGDLFSLPLHVAAVPTQWTGAVEPRLLGQWRPLCFSISLASHVLRNRAAFRSCSRQVDDDLFVLFAGEPDFRDAIKGTIAAATDWHTKHVLESAGADAIRSAIEAKPEFFMLQCHGEILDDPLVGSVLRLHGGVLSNFGIATRQWLPRNKLTVLGACVSGRPVRFGNNRGEISSAGEIAGFIRGFIAAGCGALLVTNWSVLQQELGSVTEHIIRRIRASTGVVQLDSLLREIVDSGSASGASIDSRIERSVFQLYL
jgi:hypothetical protein